MATGNEDGTHAGRVALGQWISRRFHKHVVHRVSRALYRDTDRDMRKTVMIAGAGRSGTTWLAEIIASQNPCRIMFEPFQSKLVKHFRRFHYFQYMRPEEGDADLFGYCRKVFSGDIRDAWIDKEVATIFPKYRVVKDVRANLFLRWINDRFPDVRILFIVRHPCAVVLSRMEAGWVPSVDLDPLLAQEKLVEDFLHDKMDTIGRAQSLEAKHAVVWCINNLVPIRQFGSRGLNAVFYEDLCTRPESEFPRVFREIGHEHRVSVFDRLWTPSATTGRVTGYEVGTRRVGRWMRKLSVTQIDDILSVVSEFGLGHMYGESATPLASSLQKEECR